MAKGKRKIIFGFEKPYGLEKDNIYVTLQKNNKGIVLADAVSNTEFEFGDESSKRKSIYIASGKYYHISGNTEILDNLAEFNNSELEYSKLLKDGLELGLELKTLKDKLKELAKD